MLRKDHVEAGFFSEMGDLGNALHLYYDICDQIEWLSSRAHHTYLGATLGRSVVAIPVLAMCRGFICSPPLVNAMLPLKRHLGMSE